MELLTDKRLVLLKQEGMFTDKMIINLLIPILIEQIMVVAINIADTLMVSYSGENAVAGISLVATFDSLIKVMMSSLAIGGSIIISQYIGKGENYNANKAMKTSFYCVLFLAVVMSLILLVFRNQFLSLLVGQVEKGVWESAQTYLSLTLFSYPFFAAYYVASAAFRASGNSRTPMLCSLVMMTVNLILKAVFIYIFKMGVWGAGISTLISVALIGIIMTVISCKPYNTVHIEKISKIKFEMAMITRVLGVGIPNIIENGMFQLGILLLQRLTASFGTASIAANAIVKNLAPLSYMSGFCYGYVIITIVGQCMGAGQTEQAVLYTKHILKLSYIIALAVNLACIAFNKNLVGAFNLSTEANQIASSIFYIYCIGGILYYPTSFVLPNALRAAGDNKFTMTVSVLTMFGARIGLAFVFGLYMNMGLFGIWLAMQLDWVIRSVIFTGRFVRGKWKTIRVI